MSERSTVEEQINAAVADRDWTSAKLVTGSKSVTVVHSTRLPAEYSAALEAEATRRGVNPSKLMQTLIIAALEELKGADIVKIPRQRLYAVIEKAINDAA